MKRLIRNVYNQKSVQLEFDNATQPLRKNHIGSPCSLLRCPGNWTRKFGSINLVDNMLSWWILLVLVRQTVREKLCILVPVFPCPPLAVDIKTRLHPFDFSATFSSGGLGMKLDETCALTTSSSCQHGGPVHRFRWRDSSTSPLF